MQKRVEAGTEGFRRVRFAECDFSSPQNHKFLLDPEHIEYPNVLMYLLGQPYPFNPFDKGFTTPEQVTNYLFDTFMEKTNFFVERISCTRFQEKRAANETMTIYIGPYSNIVGIDSPMYELNHLNLFDKRTFSVTSMNLFVFDINDGKNTKGCWGQFGLPPKDYEKEGLYYFFHSEAAPLKLNRDPRDFHNMDHKEIMKVICKSDTDMKMEWTKCTFFLIDQAKENGLVLITKENDVDPSLDWLSNNVIGAYDLMKQAGLYVTPIIGALENPKLAPDIPQLWQVLGLEKEGTKFPRLFVTNGREGTAVEYPSSLDDELDFAPELIVLWARRTLLYQEIKYMKERLAALNE